MPADNVKSSTLEVVDTFVSFKTNLTGKKRKKEERKKTMWVRVESEDHSTAGSSSLEVPPVPPVLFSFLQFTLAIKFVSSTKFKYLENVICLNNADTLCQTTMAAAILKAQEAQEVQEAHKLQDSCWTPQAPNITWHDFRYLPASTGWYLHGLPWCLSGVCHLFGWDLGKCLQNLLHPVD